MKRISLKYSTNVRLVAGLALVSVLGACATLEPRAARAQACPTTQILLCDKVGSERKCQCGDAAAVSRSLTAFGLPFGGRAVW